jgi:hypothetical protein
MFPIHRYLYYRIYRSQLIAFGEKEVPEFTACFGVSLFMWVNSSCLLVIFNRILGQPIFLSVEQGKIVFLLFGFALVVFNYFRFVKKYKTIVASYIIETKRERSIRSGYILWYLLVTVVLVVVLFAL